MKSKTESAQSAATSCFCCEQPSTRRPACELLAASTFRRTPRLYKPHLKLPSKPSIRLLISIRLLVFRLDLFSSVSVDTGFIKKISHGSCSFKRCWKTLLFTDNLSSFSLFLAKLGVLSFWKHLEVFSWFATSWSQNIDFKDEGTCYMWREAGL